MSDFRNAAEIRASPERVWSTLLDLDRWPDWTPTVTRIQRLDPAPLALGSRTRIWQPRLRTAVWQVTAFDDSARTFTWTTHNPGLTILASHQVDPLGPTSRLTLTLSYSGFLSPLLACIYANLTRDYLTREATGLKAFCESASSSAQ